VFGPQFDQHLPGLEPERQPRARMTKAVRLPHSAEHQALQSETVRRVTAVHYQHSWPETPALPAGLRGSIPERLALSHRLERKAQGKARWGSLQTRSQDEGTEAEDYDEPIPTHPTTGLPSYGSMNTYDPREGKRSAWHEEHGEKEPHIGFKEGTVPQALSFHGSAPSARRAIGKSEEVPVQGLRTGQHTVSMSRVHEALESPETRTSPRFPKGHEELPHVYEDAGKYTMIDGNHRASAHMIGQQMFMHAKVLRDSDIPKVSAHTGRINRLKSLAAMNPKVDADVVENRLMRNIYGSEY
jgi:hypothetical protein